MRQDLSTYEANAIHKLDLKNRTEAILGTMDLRLRRVDAADSFNGPQFGEFLEDVQIDCEKILQIAKKKQDRSKNRNVSPTDLALVMGTKRKDTDEVVKSPEMYKAVNNCEARMKSFKEYFID